MSIQFQQKQDKTGAALAAVMIVSFILTSLVFGVLYKARLLSTYADRKRQRTQNLWVCEMGLVQTVDRFYQNGSCLDWSDTVNDNGRDIELSVDVVQQGQTTGFIKNYQVLSSIEEDGNTIREIQQHFEVEYKPGLPDDITIILGEIPGGLHHPDHDPDDVLVLGNNSLVVTYNERDDKVYLHGNLDSGSVPTLTDLVMYLSGVYDSDSEDILENQELPDRTELIEVMLELMDDIENEIDFTSAPSIEYNNRDMIINISEGDTLILRGYRGGSDVSVDGLLTINGGGTIIVEGDLELGNKTVVSIPDGASLYVEGDIDGSNRSTISVDDEDTVIYTGGHLHCKNNLDVSGTLLVGEYLEAKNSSSSDVFIFCKGWLEIKNKGSFEGVIIANQLIGKNTFEITVDSDNIPNWLIQMLIEKGVTSSNPSDEVEKVTVSGWELIK